MMHGARWWRGGVALAGLVTSLLLVGTVAAQQPLTLPMSITGALITLSDSVLYPFYTEAPRVSQDLGALADQQIGGLLMWVVGGLALWGAMTVVWFRWAVRERNGDAEQAVPLEVYAVTPR